MSQPQPPTPEQIQNALYDADRSYAFAIRFDSPRDVKRAIYHYQQAVAALEYIDPTRRLYQDRLVMYFDRIHALQSEMKPEPTDTRNKRTHVAQNTISFKDVIGLQEAKDALRASLIYPIKRPDLYKDVATKRNVLLYGPHGCGKSLLASAVGSELNATVMVVDLSSIYGKFYGDAEAHVRSIFQEAREYSTDKPIVMVIDEVDGLMGRHRDSSTESRVIGILLSELDGVTSSSSNNFVILSMTNRPWDLDVGFIRRHPRRILVTLPDHDARIDIFKLHLDKLKTDNIDYTRLARMYDGYNAADIRQVSLDAHAITVHELMTSPHYNEKQMPRSITMDDFVKIKQTRKSSVSPDILRSCHNWHGDYGA